MTCRKADSSLHLIAMMLCVVLAACRSATPPPAAPDETAALPRVLAVESFLADMTRNVASDRLAVETLIPLGLDPHAFEPTPRDVAKVAESQVLIVNGAGLETWLDEVLANAGGQRLVVEAAHGLIPRGAPVAIAATGDEPEHEGEPAPGEHAAGHQHEAGDPHFWLDPTNVLRYVANIRDGLTAADPGGREVYAANAEAYREELRALDAFIAAEVESIPTNRRLLVTNHESLGYFADRYGLTVVGTIIPGASTGAAPSARQLADLVDRIDASGAPAIFLETGANPQLATQVARETGVQVVTDLYTHSITGPDGPAPTYIEMMRHNVRRIVAALR